LDHERKSGWRTENETRGLRGWDGNPIADGFRPFGGQKLKKIQAFAVDNAAAENSIGKVGRKVRIGDEPDFSTGQRRSQRVYLYDRERVRQADTDRFIETIDMNARVPFQDRHQDVTVWKDAVETSYLLSGSYGDEREEQDDWVHWHQLVIVKNS